MADPSFVETALARYHYSREGAGPPVLLLPGSGGWALTFPGQGAGDPGAVETVPAQRMTVRGCQIPPRGIPYAIGGG
jgi:hypothetical protein